jgi:hypothetical protein
MYPSLEQITKSTKFGANDLPFSIKMVVCCSECQTHNVMPVNIQTRYVECMKCAYWIEWMEVSLDEN